MSEYHIRNYLQYKGGKLSNKKNPKSHDQLFKWLIRSFIDEFFEHYFPQVKVKIKKDAFIDKEFIRSR